MDEIKICDIIKYIIDSDNIVIERYYDGSTIYDGDVKELKNGDSERLINLRQCVIYWIGCKKNKLIIEIDI